MALIVDQQSNFKHFCKICKKGFGCGRALGGHMRAHGIGDESGQIDDDDDDPPSDWEDKIGGGNNVPSTNNKCMYALRTNPNRLKTCRNCENCGKEFLSWKSFLEHGKCSSSVDAAESLVSSPDYEDDRRGCSGWSKRKRSLRAKVGTFGNSHCPSSEEEDLANCLMMLSNATVDPMEAEPEESCASASKEEERIRNPMNNYMAPISRGVVVDNNKAKGIANKGLFECKACKKVFNSHQALGGHRASHKKVKGCFAARLDHLEDSMADDDVITHEEFFPSKPNSSLQFDHGSNGPSSAYTSKRKSKVHECSICHRIFSSGQALGGHKRCHWITSNAAPDTSTLAKFHEFQESMEQQMMNQQRPKLDTTSDPLDLKLDLNLPALAADENGGGGGRRDGPITNPNPSSLEVSTDFFLQSWVGTKEEDNAHHRLHSRNQIDNDNNIINNDEYNVDNNNNSSGSMQNVVDEADSKVKLAKLSELKDINTSGSSSPWLQVGLGSTTNVAADP